MAKFHTALTVATVALSPSSTSALSLFPQRGPVHRTPISGGPSPRTSDGSTGKIVGGGLFGKKSNRRGITQQWMLPSFRSSRFLSRVYSTTKEKEEPFFAADDEPSDDDDTSADEKSWPIKPTPPMKPPPTPKTQYDFPAPADDEPSAFQNFISTNIGPLLNPTIAKNVPSNTIQGAAINGSFLTLLASFILFGPLSVSSLSTLVVAASVGIITAYVSICKGDAGDFARGIGGATMKVTDSIVSNVDQIVGEREVGKIANALLQEPPKASAPAPPKKAATKTKADDTSDSMPLTEGMTGEEAEEVRTARLTGKGAEAEVEEAQTQVTEGQTAEEAEESRNARLDAADESAKTLEKQPSVDYDATAKLAYNAAGSQGDFDAFKAQYLVDASTMVGQKYQDAILAEEESKAEAEAEKKRKEEEVAAAAEAQAKADEEERLKAEAEVRAQELEAQLKAEEEARAQDEAEAAAAAAEAQAKADEEARLQAEAEARAQEEARLKAEAEAQAEEEARLQAEAQARAEEEARLKAEEEEAARLAEEMATSEEQRVLEEQAEAAREAVRLMEEQEALMDDEEDMDEEDELDDEDWEASVRLANELQGVPQNSMGGDVMDDIGDDLLQYEIDNLSQEEEDALGKAAREAVRKYEEDMMTKQSKKEAVRSSWDDEMVAPPQPPAEVVVEDETPAPAAVDYSKMTVVQLKDELRSKGLKVSGKKADLIERLESSS